jgi:hypothetical protein
MGEGSKSLGQLVLAALISGAVASSIVGVIFTGHVTKVEEEIRSRITWKEQSVAELLGPMNIQFARTKRAFDRWNDENRYLEAKIIKVGNETILNLLLEKGHLIPPELLNDAGDLIEHYDFWLELFEKERGGTDPSLESKFVFAAPEGFGFPKHAEEQFKKKYDEYWKDLYGDT